MAEKRLVFTADVAADDLRDFAAQNGWKSVDRPASTGDPDEEIPNEDLLELWWETDQGATVHYAANEVLEVAYISAKGTGATAAADLIHSQLPSADLAEALSEVDFSGETSTVELSLRRLARVVPPKFDQAVFDATVKGLRDKRSTVRLGALDVAGITAWREFAEAVGKIADDDPDQLVRQMGRTTRMILEL